MNLGEGIRDILSTLPVDILRILPQYLSLSDGRIFFITAKRFNITDAEEPTNSIFTERYYERRVREIAGPSIDKIREAVVFVPKPTWRDLLRRQLPTVYEYDDTYRSPEEELRDRFLFIWSINGHEQTVRGNFGYELSFVSEETGHKLNFSEEGVWGMRDFELYDTGSGDTVSLVMSVTDLESPFATTSELFECLNIWSYDYEFVCFREDVMEIKLLIHDRKVKMKLMEFSEHYADGFRYGDDADEILSLLKEITAP